MNINDILTKIKDSLLKIKDRIVKSDLMKPQYCCICGDKIPAAFFADYLPGTEKSDALLLCKRCHARLQEARFGRNVEKNAEYFNKFSPKIKNKIIKEYIKSAIEKGRIERDAVEEAKQQRKAKAKQRQINLRDIVLTTSCNVEGCRIIEYIGPVSTEVAMGMGYFDKLTKRFAKIANPPPEPIWEILAAPRQVALNRLRVVGVDRGANAIIGMTIDYTTIGESILALIVNGTAVLVEKIEPELELELELETET